MKLISWNYKKYYSAKAKHILTEKPDIVIVPECEHPDLFTFENDDLKPADEIWFENPGEDREIGVFSYSNYKIKLLYIYNAELKYVLPIEVTNDDFTFILLAVWTHKKYTNQIWDAIKYYSDLLNGNIIIAGDFNSNSLGDDKNKANSHSDFVKHLEGKNIFSLYHFFTNELQGKETKPTFYWYHYEDKPFHIDYCFASSNFNDRLQKIEIGKL